MMHGVSNASYVWTSYQYGPYVAAGGTCDTLHQRYGCGQCVWHLFDTAADIDVGRHWATWTKN
jgi:hypothetical protein